MFERFEFVTEYLKCTSFICFHRVLVLHTVVNRAYILA